MKKLLIPIILMAVFATADAQTAKNESADKPEKIVTFVKTEHSTDWYAKQAKLWEAEVKKDPNNDDAWINWYRATRYKIMFEANDANSKNDNNHDYIDGDYSPLKDIAVRLAKERPDSYARYTIDYFCDMFVSGFECEDNMLKAIEMRPDNEEMYTDYVVYLLRKGETNLMAEILKKWYNTGEYSYSLLNYAYNEMAGLEQNGIIFVNGDTPTFSKLLVKYGKDLFPDISVICMSLLATPEYRKTVSNELGISSIPEPDYQNYAKWTDDAVMHIIRESKRPCYFSTVIPNLPSFQDKLYSEGLVYKYSDRRYDNLAVKQENYEKRYLLDYLYEQFTPETYEATAYKLNLNYIPCFKSLLNYYKESGQKQKYSELYGLMKLIVFKTDGISDDTRKYYLDEIDR